MVLGSYSGKVMKYSLDLQNSVAKLQKELKSIKISNSAKFIACGYRNFVKLLDSESLASLREITLDQRIKTIGFLSIKESLAIGTKDGSVNI